MARPYTFNPSMTMYVKDWVAPPFTQVRSAAAMQMTPWLSFDQEITFDGRDGYIQRFLLDPALTPLVGYFQNNVQYHRVSYQPTIEPDFAIIEAIPIMEGNFRHCWLIHCVRQNMLDAPAPPSTVVLSAPIGMIMAYAPSTVLPGWEKCWGQAISRTSYADLYALIGVNYGAGDGVTTFNIPDLRSRSIVGEHHTAATPFLRGELGGNGTTTLVIANLPPHGHQVPYSLNLGTAGTVRLGDAGTGGVFTTGLSNGASLPFSNWHPYQVIPYNIKVNHVSGQF